MLNVCRVKPPHTDDPLLEDIKSMYGNAEMAALKLIVVFPKVPHLMPAELQPAINTLIEARLVWKKHGVLTASDAGERVACSGQPSNVVAFANLRR